MLKEIVKSAYLWLLASLVGFLIVLPLHSLGIIGMGLLADLLYAVIELTALYICRRRKILVVILFFW